MGYLLIDHDTANHVGYHRTLREALEEVLWAIDQYGADSPEVLSLSLGRSHPDSEQGGIASGRDLAQRALALRKSGSHGTARRRTAA